MLRSATFVYVIVVFVGTLDRIKGIDPNLSSTGSVSHFEPQVAILCDVSNRGQEAYQPKYMTEQGEWASDLRSKASCLKDKMDILNYCKMVYPKRDITNIVESSHYLKIGSWCKAGATPGAQSRGKCKTARWVKPFRCLEGPFQSDALLVPENCMFDHIHNQSNCWTFGRWNATAGTACQDKKLQLRSFAMLLPCGISLFSGVEFVCCPKHFKESVKPKKPVELAILKKEQDVFSEALDDSDDDSDEDDSNDDLEDVADDTELSDEPSIDDEDDDEEDDDDYDDSDWDTTSQSTTIGMKVPTTSATTTTTTTSTTTTEKPTTEATPDPYFTHFDPRNEHNSYKEAQERLEETHREKVTRVMKDWSDLEERYQDMRSTNPRGADEFRQRMTQRFQQTVQALEEEGDAEKHQLAAMHQQRVLAHINQRKKEAMSCYTQALNESPPNTHRVQKCLQKLLRSLHKDRAHAISHYRHLLAGSIEAAAREQPSVLERLTDIDRTVNQSMQMLKRYPDLASKIGQLMDDYIQALRSKDETPGSLLAMTADAEQAILDKYKAEIATKQAERERQRLQEKERKEQRKKERTVLKEEKKRVEAALGKKISNIDDEDIEDNSVDEKPSTPVFVVSTAESTAAETVSYLATATPTSHKEVDDVAVQEAVEEVAKAATHRQDVIRVAHVMSHEISHGEPTFTVRREIYGRRDGKSVYFTVAFAGMALMAAIVVGVAVAKRRSARSPQSQGFVEVDQAATPEERHVANMQINGYENPTYKYFEVKE
ncbi:amyloid-beta-like protein isoform X1 [Dendroctonus ponderosae]|uniref:amyloid-beta-like protein isoform X1 n=1 Tax=Dendroctonus ponderosae TaxID=77166 RepID=UPI002035C8B5|nr:amyloid-beta-like protein isoform X1 [Dendroctonus ponderosae]